MLVAYLLLFLLHLSAASTCDATDRNLFLPGAAYVPAPSPEILDHGHATKDLSYYDVHYHPAVMARRGGPPPRPWPGVGASGGVEGAPPPSLLAGVEASGVEGDAPPPPEKDASFAMDPAPSPSPRQVDGGGGEGGTSSSEASAMEDQEESATEDVGVDYEGPKTHPPSHN